MKHKPKNRSEMMASIHRKDTGPEVLLRKHLWKMGVRGYQVDAKLPGRPDLYFSRAKLAVFVDGCFWHGCPEHFVPPKSNQAYWGPKIERNRARDNKVVEELRGQGIRTIRVWAHTIETEISEAGHRILQALDAVAVNGS